MGFGDLKSESGLAALNEWLADKSYVAGYVYAVTCAIIINLIFIGQFHGT